MINLTLKNTFLKRMCCYHIRDVRRISRHLRLSIANIITRELLACRLDYCYSFFPYHIVIKDITLLQRVQTCLSSLVITSPQCTHSKPLLNPYVCILSYAGSTYPQVEVE